MTDWIVRMDVIPGFMEGGQNDELVGGRHRTFNVSGEEIIDALAAANHIITGIKTNPKVWRCHITAIEKTRR